MQSHDIHSAPSSPAPRRTGELSDERGRHVEATEMEICDWLSGSAVGAQTPSIRHAKWEACMAASCQLFSLITASLGE